MRLARNILIGLAILAVLLTALIQWRAHERETALAESHPPEGQLIDLGDGDVVHAVVMGSGPTVVLIHGASSNTRDFTFALAPALAEDFRVIVLDRPGFGYSTAIWDRDGGSITSQANRLDAALQALDVSEAVLVGHSYGGAVALAWAQADSATQIKSLVLIGAPTIPWRGQPPALIRATATWWGRAFLVPAIAAFVPEARLRRAVETALAPQDPPQGYTDHFGPMLSARRQTLRSNARQRMHLKEQVISLLQGYPTMDLPVEILHGDADTIVYASWHNRLTSSLLPNAEVTRLSGIGHAPHHAKPAVVITAIKRAAARAGLN